MRPVAGVLVEELTDMVDQAAAHTGWRIDRRPAAAAEGLFDVFALNGEPAVEDQRAVDAMLQLADIAWPGVGLEDGFGFVRDGRLVALQLAAEPLQEIIHQPRDI